MLRRPIICAAVLATLSVGWDARGFALQGPALGYESDPLGYSPGEFPQNLGEENRVTLPNLFYACDASFLDYFGERGRQEAGKAIGYLNNLPAFSSMSDDLSEFPMVTYRENYRADALLITDLKSQLMNLLLADFGLTNPEYYMWSVRARALPAGRECPFYQWVLIVRNFDPVTWEPSSYVNGTLYTYEWLLSCSPAPDQTIPFPAQIDPTDLGFSAVAGSLLGARPPGEYYTGLSRDDIGGLRYIYRRNNYNFETLPGNIIVGGGGGANWGIVDPNLTNVVVDTSGVRGGVDSFSIEERPYDSLLSQFFVAFTNQFSSTLITNGIAVQQSFGRPVTGPDIIFQADNLAVNADGTYTVFDVGSPGFANAGAGPGTIDIGGGVPLTYTLNKIGRTFLVDNPNFLTELEAQPIAGLRWGSFDGTTNEPVLYPAGASIREVEQQVLGQ